MLDMSYLCSPFIKRCKQSSDFLFPLFLNKNSLLACARRPCISELTSGGHLIVPFHHPSELLLFELVTAFWATVKLGQIILRIRTLAVSAPVDVRGVFLECALLLIKLSKATTFFGRLILLSPTQKIAMRSILAEADCFNIGIVFAPPFDFSLGHFSVAAGGQCESDHEQCEYFLHGINLGLSDKQKPTRKPVVPVEALKEQLKVLYHKMSKMSMISLTSS